MGGQGTHVGGCLGKQDQPYQCSCSTGPVSREGGKEKGSERGGGGFRSQGIGAGVQVSGFRVHSTVTLIRNQTRSAIRMHGKKNARRATPWCASKSSILEPRPHDSALLLHLFVPTDPVHPLLHRYTCNDESAICACFWHESFLHDRSTAAALPQEPSSLPRYLATSLRPQTTENPFPAPDPSLRCLFKPFP